MKNFKGFKVFFFKGAPSMPNVMFLPGKILIKKGSLEEKYVRSLMTL